MQLKIIIAVICILLLISGVAYKYQEYQYLKTLISSYQSTLTEKLTILEEYNNSQNEASKDIKTYFFQKPDTSIKDTLTNLDKAIKSAKLVQGMVQDYERQINQNRKNFQNIRKSNFLLFGSIKEFSDKFLTSVDNYYQKENQTVQDNKVAMDFSINLLETLKDYSIALNYLATAAKLPNNKVAASFYELSSLEKYSRDDFTFQNEEEIKKSMSYEYEILNKYRQYLKSYYLVVRDYMNGNYDSAAYKATRLTTDTSNLTIDWGRIGKEGEVERIKRGKAILEDMITQLTLLQNLKKNGLGEYPYLEEVAFSKTDLLSCHIYSYKKGVYYSVTSEYPKAKTIEELFKELSVISPKTNELDSEFDKNSMQYTNTDDEIEVACEDKGDNKSYTFTTLK
ncbi:MAG: hypothetical protein Q7R97_00205 [Candidatus Daviesbacteria bacterium]|nr:hypothetical protein [Candidatus Daviesbacteria bacterium]